MIASLYQSGSDIVWNFRRDDVRGATPSYLATYGRRIAGQASPPAVSPGRGERSPTGNASTADRRVRSDYGSIIRNWTPPSFQRRMRVYAPVSFNEKRRLRDQQVSNRNERGVENRKVTAKEGRKRGGPESAASSGIKTGRAQRPRVDGGHSAGGLRSAFAPLRSL